MCCVLYLHMKNRLLLLRRRDIEKETTHEKHTKGQMQQL